jgi:sulfite reductase (NADPH) flavoprotein alpha-component
LLGLTGLIQVGKTPLKIKACRNRYQLLVRVRQKLCNILILKDMFTGIRKLLGGVKTAPEKDVVTILYGSKSGNAEFVAGETFRHLKDLGQKARLKSLSSYKAGYLKDEATVLFVVSTHGEGDPPPAAMRFFKQLFLSDDRLPELRFSVCALGDSEYEHYCKAGRDLESRLLQLGAKPFSERVDCDDAFETAASGWISAVTRKLTHADGTEALKLEKHAREWIPAVIREKRQLNSGAGDPVFHIRLSVDPAAVSYRSGDSIGIIPQNPANLADRVLACLKWSPVAPVDTRSGLTAREFLLTKAELTNLNKALLQRYHGLSGNENLADLLQQEEACRAYWENHDFLDLLEDFPYPFKPEELPALLDRLKVRYYSIASFQPETPGEIHLTVRQLRFFRRNRLRQGACSNYLSEWLDPGTSVSFFIAPDEEFRLPADPAVPAVFIAAGTGIAPVRAFLTEREAHPASLNWLFFGAKNRESDFLYQEQLEHWLASGNLEHLDLAFSRDQAVKVYVQDLILKRGEELLRWIDAGAHIYVCGSVAMGKEVRATLNTLLQNGSGGGSTDKLIAEKRYCEDVY